MEGHWIHAACVKAPVRVGVGPRCSLKSTVIYQERLEHIMPSLADKLYGDADFIFQHCQRYQKLVQ